jgi:DNA helicase-2/ATP-dependent DNA helicase PcrA
VAETSDYANNRAEKLYAAYQARLIALNTCDFGDLLLHITEILRNHPDVLERYHRLFRYILVDEYQDTNLVQYMWLRLLAQGHKNICCVGDDDQSIYSWRGAEIENILRFEKDFPGAVIVRLESNYRSTHPILAAASGLIAKNEGRLGKTLRSGRNDAAGEKVRVVSLWDSEEEARMVGGRIEEAQKHGQDLGEIAILVRAGFQTRSFEERLITLGIPYRVFGGAKFYERLEIRDAIAYFRALASPNDDLAFERIVNTPKRGLGDTAITALHVTAREQSVPLRIAAERLVEAGELRPKPRAALRELIEGLNRWRAALDREGHVVVAAMVLDESGYTEMWKNDRSPEAPGRLDNLKELLRAMADFATLEAFLEHIALVMENDDKAEGARVGLMTLHAAKGLEFDMVFLPGWEEGLFPSQRSLDEGGAKSLEEERRLAYVGITRARKTCIISHAANRRIYGNWTSSIPSRFLDELPEGEIKREGADVRPQPPSNVFSAGPLLGTRRPRVIEAGAWEVQARPAPSGAMQPGQRVFHQKFGYGRVTGVDDDKLDIEFERAGTKRVLDRFVEKA